MRSGEDLYRFGPFELDSGRRRLSRGREPVAIPDRHLELLLLLASNPGHIVAKDALSEAGWRDTFVSDNSITQAIKSLRKALGNQNDGAPYIKTVVGQGYRFIASVERAQPSQPNVALDTLLAPYRAFVEGRAALETLDRGAIVRARQAFETALTAAPDYPAAHIGMANACVLAFESTRVDAAPDLAALQQADRHAREGCRLDPSSGDAWSTLGFVLHRNGNPREATAAVRKAVRLEPEDWRHYVRLAFVTWGEERLRAAHRALTLCPGLALGHWFAATVFVARQAFDTAIEHLHAGCAAQDTQWKETGRFRAVGLHLLHGLVLAARGASIKALEEFERELALENEGHVYARECGANTWYACGALRLRQGLRDEAEAAFHEALKRVPGHAMAAVGLAAVSPSPRGGGTPPGCKDVDAAMVNAAILALRGKHPEAAGVCGEALAHADPGSAGWLLAVEPLLCPTAHREAWAPTLAILRDRAA
jgi:DNA-binding winged helix-turn-helix (wHTH) protein